MTDIHEQRINIKFRVKLGKSFTGTHFFLMRNAYGNRCLGRTLCYDWFKRFKDGRESVDDDVDVNKRCSCDEIVRSNRLFEKSRKIVTFRLVRVMKSWWENSKRTALQQNLSLGRCRKIRKTIATTTTCQELLDRANGDEMKQIITGDETRAYGVETKVQSSQWVGKLSWISVVILKIGKHAHNKRLDKRLWFIWKYRVAYLRFISI